MSDELQHALDQLTAAIKSGSEVSKDDLAAWRAALAAAQERIEMLEKAAGEVIDAYLLRALPEQSGTRQSRRSQHRKRLAAAMAELEKEIDKHRT